MPDDNPPLTPEVIAGLIKEGQKALAHVTAAEDQAMSFIAQHSERLIRLGNSGPTNGDDLNLMMKACQMMVIFQRIYIARDEVKDGIESMKSRL